MELKEVRKLLRVNDSVGEREVGFLYTAFYCGATDFAYRLNMENNKEVQEWVDKVMDLRSDLDHYDREKVSELLENEIFKAYDEEISKTLFIEWCLGIAELNSRLESDEAINEFLDKINEIFNSLYIGGVHGN